MREQHDLHINGGALYCVPVDNGEVNTLMAKVREHTTYPCLAV